MTETRAARRGRDVRNERARARAERDTVSPRYKWVVLSNTTLGVLIATINSSILLIALPDIFRGIHINPLEPGNTSLLLWLIMGYMVVTAVLVVGLGRLGDMYGRVRIYNAGFAIFTFFSIMLAVTWMHGVAAALWLVAMRIFQGVGGAMLMANSSAIITDAFPPDERGLGLGLNMVAAIAGSFIGLIVGGLLAPDRVAPGLRGLRAVRPVRHRLGLPQAARHRHPPARPDGLVGQRHLRRRADRGAGRHHLRHPAVRRAHDGLDQPVGADGDDRRLRRAGGVLLDRDHGSPSRCSGCACSGSARSPFGNVASLLGALGRGGLMFILIIWLQGIWLPLHGYSFEPTPLWAGIYMLPMTVGFLVAGPDLRVAVGPVRRAPVRHRRDAGRRCSFVWLWPLPVNFAYWQFAAALLINGLGMGLFAAPNRAGIMNSLPAHQRGVGAGMSATFRTPRWCCPSGSSSH